MALEQPLAHGADAAFLDGVANGERGGSLQRLTGLWLAHDDGGIRGRNRLGRGPSGWRRGGREIEGRALERRGKAQTSQDTRPAIHGGRGRDAHT